LEIVGSISIWILPVQLGFKQFYVFAWFEEEVANPAGEGVTDVKAPGWKSDFLATNS
jgi:hypothetical protein